MEPQTSENSNRHHLLDVTETEPEELNETVKDFLEQNVVISREIQKYDQQLQTLPMIVYRFWLFLYFVFLVIDPIVFLLYDLANKKEIGTFFLFMQLMMTTASLQTIIGCFQLWFGIYSKSLEKIEDAISKFENYLGAYALYFIVTMVNYFWNGSMTNINHFILFLVGAMMTGISMVPAIHVRNILKKRKTLVNVSSYEGNEGK